MEKGTDEENGLNVEKEKRLFVGEGWNEGGKTGK